MAKKKDNGMRKNYQNRLLIIGIMLVSFGLYQLPTILTFKSNLTQIRGTLRDADTYITTITDRRGHESRKSELVFYINGQKQKFYLAENIGDNWRNDKYIKILQGLKQADTITVWIKKSEVEKYEPQVFQIDNDRTTLLDFETIRTAQTSLTTFMILLGFGSITLFLWLRFSGKKTQNK